MITPDKLSLDAAVRLKYVHLDKSAATDSLVLHYDDKRHWSLQRLQAVITETLDTAAAIINVGVVGDTDSIVDGVTTVTTTAAAGTVVDLITSPVALTKGTVYVWGHEQTTGTGEFELVAHMVPVKTNINTKADS